MADTWTNLPGGPNPVEAASDAEATSGDRNEPQPLRPDPDAAHQHADEVKPGTVRARKDGTYEMCVVIAEKAMWCPMVEKAPGIYHVSAIIDGKGQWCEMVEEPEQSIDPSVAAASGARAESPDKDIDGDTEDWVPDHGEPAPTEVPASNAEPSDAEAASDAEPPSDAQLNAEDDNTSHLGTFLQDSEGFSTIETHIAGYDVSLFFAPGEGQKGAMGMREFFWGGSTKMNLRRLGRQPVAHTSPCAFHDNFRNGPGQAPIIGSRL